jgi:hypothetical protein
VRHLTCSYMLISIAVGFAPLALGQAQQKALTSLLPSPIQVTLESPPNSYSPIRDTATVLSLILGGLSLFLVLRGHKISRAALDAKAAWDTLNLLEGNDRENRKLWYLLEKLISDAEGQNKKFDILQASSKTQRELHELARACDMAGHLVKHRLISDEFLFDFYSRPLVVTWQYLEPYIEQKRNNPALRQPGHMLQFQILATGAALYRKKKHPAESIFQTKPEIENLWRAWKKGTWSRRTRSTWLTQIESQRTTESHRTT